MRVIITKKDEFGSKTGKNYVKLSYLSTDGVAGEVFTDQATYLEQKLDEKLIATKETLGQIENLCDVVELSFDNRGRFVSIKG